MRASLIASGGTDFGKIHGTRSTGADRPGADCSMGPEQPWKPSTHRYRHKTNSSFSKSRLFLKFVSWALIYST